jgi:hypothetical protein
MPTLLRINAVEGKMPREESEAGLSETCGIYIYTEHKNPIYIL